MQLLQGRGVFGIEMCIFDNSGGHFHGRSIWRAESPRPWVAKGYYGLTDVPGDEDAPLINGWFDTGDVASISQTAS